MSAGGMKIFSLYDQRKMVYNYKEIAVIAREWYGLKVHQMVILILKNDHLIDFTKS
jgi:hypothetical protein